MSTIRESTPRESRQEVRATPLIVIVTGDDRATLRGVVEGALATGLPVLVVNDGSRDGAAETLEGLRRYKRVDHETRRGKGAAILTAADWAAGHGFSHLITLEGDGRHDPSEAPKFLEIIRKNPLAIVAGARAGERSRRIGRGFSNVWFRAAAGASLPDTRSGYSAYPVPVLRALGCRGRGREFEVEALVRAAWAGLPLESVPVTAREARPRPLAEALRVAGFYARAIARHGLPWPHRRLKGLEYENPERISLRQPIKLLEAGFREKHAPGRIAAAAMLGIFLGTLPLIGFRGPAIAFAAARLRLSRVIANSISVLCFWPLLAVLCIEIGHALRFGRLLTDLSFRTLVLELPWRLYEYLLGALAAGPLFAAAVGLATYAIARAYQQVVLSGNAEYK